VWLCAQKPLPDLGSEDQSIVTPYTFSTVDIADIKIAGVTAHPFGVSLVALGALTWFLACDRTWARPSAPSARMPCRHGWSACARRVARSRSGWLGVVGVCGGLLTLLFSFILISRHVFNQELCDHRARGLESLPGSRSRSGAGRRRVLFNPDPGWRGSLIICWHFRSGRALVLCLWDRKPAGSGAAKRSDAAQATFVVGADCAGGGAGRLSRRVPRELTTSVWAFHLIFVTLAVPGHGRWLPGQFPLAMPLLGTAPT